MSGASGRVASAGARLHDVAFWIPCEPNETTPHKERVLTGPVARRLGLVPSARDVDVRVDAARLTWRCASYRTHRFESPIVKGLQAVASRNGRCPNRGSRNLLPL